MGFQPVFRAGPGALQAGCLYYLADATTPALLAPKLGTGTIVIRGLKVLEFFDDFADHRTAGLKADGKEIISVEIDLPRESQQ